MVVGVGIEPMTRTIRAGVRPKSLINQRENPSLRTIRQGLERVRKFQVVTSFPALGIVPVVYLRASGFEVRTSCPNGDAYWQLNLDWRVEVDRNTVCANRDNERIARVIVNAIVLLQFPPPPKCREHGDDTTISEIACRPDPTI